MNPKLRKQRFLTVLAALLLLAVLPGIATARAADAPQRALTSAPCVFLSAPPAASWLDKVFNSLVSALYSQKRMVQFCLVGMVIALWILWWRK